MKRNNFAFRFLFAALLHTPAFLSAAAAEEPKDGIQTDPPDIPLVRLENSKGMSRAVFSKDGKYVIGWCPGEHPKQRLIGL